MLDATAPFTLKETHQSICELKAGKAPGPNNIPGDLYKSEPDVLVPYLNRINNAILAGAPIPYTWRGALIIPIHKKGLKADCDRESLDEGNGSGPKSPEPSLQSPRGTNSSHMGGHVEGAGRIEDVAGETGRRADSNTEREVDANMEEGKQNERTVGRRGDSGEIRMRTENTRKGKLPRDRRWSRGEAGRRRVIQETRRGLPCPRRDMAHPDM
ncbi:hypothetical protein NDU88_002100 [Pleurodeles waltl]|uniref:Reverse transcriptase n=1 Tax=Pleurodeles waltl TaxID=8319 RepID=A0AAV7L0C2_PLEWA|nr:hypothetical protein NDU88_002100 [Pleurodeles waltl]